MSWERKCNRATKKGRGEGLGWRRWAGIAMHLNACGASGGVDGGMEASGG